MDDEKDWENYKTYPGKARVNLLSNLFFWDLDYVDPERIVTTLTEKASPGVPDN